LIKDIGLKELCDKDFVNLGILFKSLEADLIKKDIETSKWPCFAVYRQTIYEKEDLVGFVVKKL
jgi:hypothetical protein